MDLTPRIRVLGAGTTSTGLCVSLVEESERVLLIQYLLVQQDVLS